MAYAREFIYEIYNTAVVEPDNVLYTARAHVYMYTTVFYTYIHIIYIYTHLVRVVQRLYTTKRYILPSTVYIYIYTYVAQ